MPSKNWKNEIVESGTLKRKILQMKWSRISFYVRLFYSTNYIWSASFSISILYKGPEGIHLVIKVKTIIGMQCQRSFIQSWDLIWVRPGSTTASERWMLLSAQLSNNFWYCPSCTVSCIVWHLINTTAYHWPNTSLHLLLLKWSMFRHKSYDFECNVSITFLQGHKFR